VRFHRLPEVPAMNPNLRRLDTDPPRKAVTVRLVQPDYRRGRQYGIGEGPQSTEPFVYARYGPEGSWCLWAGPFADESAGEAWIGKL
jgi:hypothetical protein